MTAAQPQARRDAPASVLASDAIVLRRYLEGDECDPKGAFRLADDRWDLDAYSPQGHWRMDSRYRVNFGLLQSFLRPYAKWYVYERVLLQRGAASPRASTLVSVLGRADRWLLAHDVRGLDQLAAPDVFAAMWDGLLEPLAPGEPRSVNSVSRQLRTAPFWRALRAEFGSPTVILPIAAHQKPSPTDLMLRDDRTLPSPVIAQILNRLALHRDGTEPLDNYDLLRGCVLAVHIVLGRRIVEVLRSARGTGENGPLVDYPTTHGESALGFRFHPVKGGPDDVVYISPAWVDITCYAVAQLLRLGDEIRHLSVPEDRDLLVLTSTVNSTRGGPARHLTAAMSADPTRRPSRGKRRTGTSAWPLNYSALRVWLNGKKGLPLEGVMTRWNITADGSSTGPIFVLRSHAARHARQTALMADPNVPRLAAQRDLNHRSVEMQSAYQHGLAAHNDALIAKARDGRLAGSGSEWIRQRLEGPGLKPGTPRLIPDDPRFAELLESNPAFLALTRVPMGYCAMPQGPAACPERLLCVEATEAGCFWFATDPSDPTLRAELDERAATRRADVDEATGQGQVVLAGKLAVLAERAERMRDGVAAIERLQVARDRLREEP